MSKVKQEYWGQYIGVDKNGKKVVYDKNFGLVEYIEQPETLEHPKLKIKMKLIKRWNVIPK